MYNTEERVFAASGSPRKGGNSDHLMKAVLKPIEKAGIPCHTTYLRDCYYKPCMGCEYCRENDACKLMDGMQILYPRIMLSRGMALVCPTHNYNITAWMKSFIDRLYRFYHFENTRPRKWSSKLAGQGRKAVIIGVCEQMNPDDMGFTLEAMRLPLEALGYEIIGETAVYGIFDKGKVAGNKDVLTKVEKLGEKLADAVMEK